MYLIISHSIYIYVCIGNFYSIYLLCMYICMCTYHNAHGCNENTQSEYKANPSNYCNTIGSASEKLSKADNQTETNNYHQPD
ncbi:hypothetical protein Hanom_Chr08g00745681 [Helianthus anomalus]